MKKIVIILIAFCCTTQTIGQCVNLAVGTFYPKANTPGAVNDSLQLIVSQCSANTYNVFNNGMLYAPGYTVTVTGTNPATNNGSTKVAVLPAVPYLFQVKTVDGSCFSNYVAYNFSVLPVKLISFNAFVANDRVTLRWKVESNQDAEHYKIERSVNGVEFKEVGLIFPDNLLSAAEYVFADQKVAPGQYYYRLKMVNKDGKIEYSSVVTVKIGDKNNGMSITVMPNPAVSTILLRLDGKTLTGSDKVRITDISGKIILMPGVQNSSVNVQSLSPGTYILEVISNNASYKTKFIKQ